MRARSAEPLWDRAERRGAADLREAARILGMRCEIVVVPAFSDIPRLELEAVGGLLRRQLADADVVAIVAHAELGGSGLLHAAARSCGLPVIGASALAIERGFDKLGARAQLRRDNIPVPVTVELDGATGLAGSTAALARLGWPCVIKPRRGVAGDGVTRLDAPPTADALACLTEADDRPRLIEREIVGRELSVVVLDGEVLGIAEIEHPRAWHTAGPSAVICPPSLDRCTRAGIENLARRACASLQLDEGLARVDLIRCPRGNEVVLEVEPLPQLHRDSVVARVARAAGLSYPRLCAQLLRVSQPTGVRAPSHASALQ